MINIIYFSHFLQEIYPRAITYVESPLWFLLSNEDYFMRRKIKRTTVQKRNNDILMVMNYSEMQSSVTLKTNHNIKRSIRRGCFLFLFENQ